ncbi:MAG: AAA family ATPase [Spirochaetes bacterium]|nr:AAA family ATPase [Spirochaetota bacterium]
MNSHKSNIITFYSYKGGVGRSMALANVAWLLAKNYNKTVLVVDWDLEAPGLHKYFNITDEQIKKGLIDIFYDYKNLIKKEVKSLDNNLLNLDDYIIQPSSEFIDDGCILIIPAGKQDEKYANRVNNFNWDDFYENWHGFGFIEYLKKQLKIKADFILIDSRTGVTDIGGICTLQMPDIAVLLFSLNEQSISGTERIIKSILNKSTVVNESKKSPKLILIPSRVERYLERDIKIKWETIALERLGYYMPTEQNTLMYIKKRSIPYMGYYSFGEMLAVKDDPYEELAQSLDLLTRDILKYSNFHEEIVSNNKIAEENISLLGKIKLLKSSIFEMFPIIEILCFLIIGTISIIIPILKLIMSEESRVIYYMNNIIIYAAYVFLLLIIIHTLDFILRNIFNIHLFNRLANYISHIAKSILGLIR